MLSLTPQAEKGWRILQQKYEPARSRAEVVDYNKVA